MIIHNIFKQDKVSEKTRRLLNTTFDTEPSIHHIFNYEISKKYIKNKVVLDIGCWSGQFVKLAVKNAREIIGIDPGKEAIAYAKQNVSNAKFKVGSAEKLPFNDNYFDCVIFLEVIEHLPKNTEAKTLKEIGRVIKKEGYLILSTPNSNLISILLDPAYFLIGHRHYSIKHLTKLLNNSNFKIIEIYQTGRLIRLLSVILSSFEKHVFKRKFKYPEWIENRINTEYYKGGFAQNHIIAQMKG